MLVLLFLSLYLLYRIYTLYQRYNSAYFLFNILLFMHCLFDTVISQRRFVGFEVSISMIPNTSEPVDPNLEISDKGEGLVVWLMPNM